jgi:hypothetical protein
MPSVEDWRVFQTGLQSWGFAVPDESDLRRAKNSIKPLKLAASMKNLDAPAR